MPAVLTFAPIRGATEDEQQCYEALEFQPTCPVRGTTPAFLLRCVPAPYFNPRAPYGARHGAAGAHCLRGHFNPRAPYGARLAGVLICQWRNSISIHVPRTGHDCRRDPRYRPASDFNPRAPYGARRSCPPRKTAAFLISIHVPRTGHDSSPAMAITEAMISIHVPRTGHDNSPFGACPTCTGFQSTCPVRGTTAKMHK